MLICLALCGMLLATVDYWLFWPYQTLEILNYSDTKPIEIENKIVEPGQPLEYVLDYCKYSDADAIVKRSFVDGQVIALKDTEGRLPTGCHKTLVKTAIVPPTINEGQYYLDVNVSYRVNPLRTVNVHYKTDYFSVVPRKAGDPYKQVVPASEQVQVLD